MYLEIVNPEASLVSGEVESITVPGIQGQFQMLNNHAPVVSVLTKGKVKFKGNPTIAEEFRSKFTQEDGSWVLNINGGTVECNNNRVMILAD
ncbi:MAG TPA: F0F1 ATP synthase subunit epsilon [Aequorivita sp.]|nr:F0F1 ATP synthase subunit epsilon [Aequorivita sp.]